MKYIGIQDKLLTEWLKGKEYITPADEAEGIAIAAGYFLQTGERATVFLSADGFCNTLNFLTSWIIPEEIEMNLVISTGRMEPPHRVMTYILDKLINLLPYDAERISFELITK